MAGSDDIMRVRKISVMNKNEKGFASIVIALILIIVLALFTVGFAQLARREQQTALDKQKATQAQYAAESGINNVYQDIVKGTINNSNADDSTCMTSGPPGTGTLPDTALSAHQDINTANGVSYSCVLVSLKTDNLQIDNLTSGSGRHFYFGTSDSPDPLIIKWGSKTGRDNFAPALSNAGNPVFKTNAKWTYPPVLEISITPVTNSNDADTLRAHTFTFYAYPSSGSSNSVVYNPSDTGQVVSGDCDAGGDSAYPCSVRLTGLSGQQFIMHVVDFYDTSSLVATSSSSVKFTGEPVIDVTGKARDVLKRLRVRVFISAAGGEAGPDNDAILPNNAIEAQNICKRIQAEPVTPDNSLGSNYDTATSASCDLSD
jgi:Tfp pilus assembly protein PilX